MRRFFLPAFALAIVIGAGLVQGFWTHRWQVGEELQRAAESLDRVPLQFGDWKVEEQDIRSSGDNGLAAQRSLRYRNNKTADVISVSLVCGRHGPASIHTPDVCYGASGYKVSKRSEVAVPVAGVEEEARFYHADMEKKSAAELQRQRIFWSWRAGGRWQVADNPRTSFARYPVLYKFYVARELGEAVNTTGALDQDPCVEFLRQFLPELESILADG